MYLDGKKYFNNTWIECVSLFANSKTSPIYLQILVDIGTLETEMSHKYGLQNSMLEESWIPSLCLCDIDFLPPSSLGFRTILWSANVSHQKWKKEALGNWAKEKSHKSSQQILETIGSLGLCVCLYVHIYVCCR